MVIFNSYVKLPEGTSPVFPVHCFPAMSPGLNPGTSKRRVSGGAALGSTVSGRTKAVPWHPGMIVLIGPLWGICLGGSLVWLFGSIWILSGCCLASLGFIWRFFFACNGLVLLNKTCNHSFNTQMLGFPTNSWNLAKGNDIIIHVYPPLYIWKACDIKWWLRHPAQLPTSDHFPQNRWLAGLSPASGKGSIEHLMGQVSRGASSTVNDHWTIDGSRLFLAPCETMHFSFQ